MIKGGAPRTISVGQTTPEGIRLISADSSSAVIEFQGKRQTLTPGGSGRLGGGSPVGSSGSSSGSVTLTADSQGHYMTLGQINGGTVQFMVDTGATAIAMSSTRARQLGINYINGQRGFTQTANGRAASTKPATPPIKPAFAANSRTSICIPIATKNTALNTSFMPVNVRST